MELSLLIPFIAGIIALTLQGGLVISDQVNLEGYAQEGALWAESNPTSATTSAIASHIYQQMCGGASGPPSTAGSKFCNSTSLHVQVSTQSTPTSLLDLSPLVQAEAAGCKSWSLSASPASVTVSQGGSVTITTVLSIGGGGSTNPTVSLSVSAYPNAISPGAPTFNPPTLTSTSTTSVLTFTTSTSTTPKTWNVAIGGIDQCGSASSTGLITVPVTVTGAPVPSPCTPPSVYAPSPSTVVAGSAVQLVVPGTGFQNGASVSFGAASATQVSVTSSTQLIATTPTTLAVGIYNLAVTNADGCTGTVFNALNVVSGAAPSPTTIALGSSACAGGGNGSYETRIVITWNEPIFIPIISGALSLKATQFTFCQ